MRWAAVARRAEPSTLAAERHQAPLAAPLAFEVREPSAEQAAVQIPSSSFLTNDGSAAPSKPASTAAARDR